MQLFLIDTYSRDTDALSTTSTLQDCHIALPQKLPPHPNGIHSLSTIKVSSYLHFGRLQKKCYHPRDIDVLFSTTSTFPSGFLWLPWRTCEDQTRIHSWLTTSAHRNGVVLLPGYKCRHQTHTHSLSTTSTLRDGHHLQQTHKFVNHSIETPSIDNHFLPFETISIKQYVLLELPSRPNDLQSNIHSPSTISRCSTVLEMLPLQELFLEAFRCNCGKAAKEKARNELSCRSIVCKQKEWSLRSQYLLFRLLPRWYLRSWVGVFGKDSFPPLFALHFSCFSATIVFLKSESWLLEFNELCGFRLWLFLWVEPWRGLCIVAMNTNELKFCVLRRQFILVTYFGNLEPQS